MNERTLVLVKPDAMKMGYAERIKARYLMKELEVVMEKRFRFTEEEAEAFYKDHEGRFYFVGLVLAMVSGPCTVMVLEGEDAIRKVRELNGATDPAKAAVGTIRADFRSAGGPFNTVHGSDSPEAFQREYEVLFPLMKE